MLTRRGLVFAVGAMAGSAAAGRAYAESGPKVVIASPPNPHVFPLLLAMHLDPSLGVSLRPVVESKDADGLLKTGEAHGVLAMSYVGAKKRVSGTVPDLRLVAPCYWRGFFQVCEGAASNLKDLIGRDLIISGPAAPGRGGGGDILFRAAARAEGLDADRDFKLHYMPMLAGVDTILKKQASAITLPSPGSSGLLTRLRMNGQASAIDLQAVFAADKHFGKGLLPLGGLHMTERAMANSLLVPELRRLEEAYLAAGDELMRNPAKHAQAITTSFRQAYQSLGGPQPMASVLERAIGSGDLVFGRGPGLGSVQAEAVAWLEKVLDKAVPATFAAGW